MKGKGLVALAALLAFQAPAVRAEDAPGEMRARFLMFAVAGGMTEQTSLRDEIWRGGRENWNRVKDAVTLFDRGKFRFATDTLEINEKGCFWNGASLFFGEAPNLNLASRQVRVISAPDVFFGREESSTIRVGSKQPFEYLVRRPDGLYERQTVDLPTGLTIRMQPKAVEGRVQLHDMAIAMQAVGMREGVPGLSLPVGRPVVQKRQYMLDLRLRMRRPYGILLRPEGGQGAIIVCLDVTDVPQAVLASIRRAFAQARIQEIEWDEEKQCYDVDADLPDGRDLDLLIAREGAVRRTAVDVPETELPAVVLKAVKTGFPLGVLAEIEQVTENGAVSYSIGVEIPGPDNDLEITVAPNGKVVRAEK